MRKFSLLLCFTLLVALFGSCEKSSDAIAESETQRGSVTIAMSGDRIVGTKGTSEGDETAIQHVQVVLLAQNGERHFGGSSGGSVTLTDVPLGVTATIKAYVNNPVDYSTDRAYSAPLLSDNYSYQFIMEGKVENVLLSNHMAIEVPVNRVVSKVEIDKVSIDPSSVFFSIHNSVTLEGFYVINVPSITYDVNFAGSVITPTAWYNKKQWVSSECDRLLVDDFTATLPYSTPHYFYVSSNYTTTDSSEFQWCPRYTRLAVKVRVDGELLWYPINIVDGNGVLPSNCHFRISSLVLKNRGSTSPDVPVQIGALSASIEVVDWVDGGDRDIAY